MSNHARTRGPARRLLFPWPFSRECLYHKYDQILWRARLPSSRWDKFHRLRKTSGSYIARAAGAETAGRHLGHSAADVTKRYLDPRICNSELDATRYLPRPLLQERTEP